MKPVQVIRNSAPKQMKKKNKYGYLFFTLPAIIWVVAFTVYPFFYSIYISFTNMNLLKPGLFKFVGLQNYINIFQSPQFWVSFKHTLTFTIIVILFQFLLGFFLAVLLNKTMKGTVFVRTAVMLPWVLPPVALGLVWAWILKGGKLGLINAVLVTFGVQPVNWLGYEIAMISLIIVAIWIGTPFSFMLELASLQKIPESLYESAAVDGATPIQKLIHVTIPMMKNTIMVNLVMITISTIGYFDIIYALTDGGPKDATEVMPLYMYHTAFKHFNLGQGAAIAMVMLVLSLIFTLIYFIAFYEREA